MRILLPAPNPRALLCAAFVCLLAPGCSGPRARGSAGGAAGGGGPGPVDDGAGAGEQPDAREGEGEVADPGDGGGEGEGEQPGGDPGDQGGEGEGEGEGGDGGDGEEDPPDCVPFREVCDGVDNDCNGEIDEDDPDLGDSCDTGERGPCWQGRKRCVEGDLQCVGVVDPLDETCDGVDNDCDGEADEGRPESNERCDAEVPGACGFGLTRCEDGFLWCDGLDPTDEVCDGLDNDCDGEVDNGMEDVVCGLGACQDIVPACLEGRDVPCDEGVPAEEEIEDNDIDDDCDGATDETGTPEVVSDVALANGQFNGTHSNFHPQSMTWDPGTGALAFMQQRTSNIDLVSLEGARTGTIAIGLSHATGIAADPFDEDSFYITDYTGNRGGPDLFQISRAGARNQISNDVQAYGGFPLAVYDGQMWRAENSNGYDWAPLRTVSIRAIDAPDVVLSSFRHGVNRGPDDYCHDGDTLWMLGWENNVRGPVDLFALNPEDGAVISEFDDLFSCADGNPAGLACDFDRNMWIWCYSEQAGTQSRLITLRY